MKKKRKTLKKGKKKGGGLFSFLFGEDRSSYPKRQNLDFEKALERQQQLKENPSTPPLPYSPPPLPYSPPPYIPPSPPPLPPSPTNEGVPSRSQSPQVKKSNVNPLWVPKGEGTPQSNKPIIKFYGVQRQTTAGSGRKRKTRKTKKRSRKIHRKK